MKLVIDIPKGIYNTAVKGGYVYSMDESKVINAIANGKLLPKGHGRLIDADELELDYDWSEYETDTGQLMVYGYQAYSSTQIESAPTIIEAESEDNKDGKV